MIESALFGRGRDAVEVVVTRLVAHPVLGLVYMLAVLPVFLLMAVFVVVGGFPGLLVHGFIWKGKQVRSAPEGTKLLHDISLVLLAGTSAALAFLYVLLQLASLISDDPRCSTMPFC